MIITSLLTFAVSSIPIAAPTKTLAEFTKPSFEAKCDLIHLDGQNSSIIMKVNSGQPYPTSGAIDASKKYSYSEIKETDTNIVINEDPFNMLPDKTVINYRVRNKSFELTLGEDYQKQVSNKTDEFSAKRLIAFFQTQEENKWFMAITGPGRQDIISIGFCFVTLEKQKLLTNAQLEEIRKK